VLERERRHDRQQYGQRRALPANLVREGPAALAFGDVVAQLTAAQRAAAQDGELLTDLTAIGLAGVPAAHERLTRLKDKRLDLRRAHAEDHRDLVVRVRFKLSEDQRGALVLRQALQVGKQRAQVLAMLDLGAQAGCRGHEGCAVADISVLTSRAQ